VRLSVRSHTNSYTVQAKKKDAELEVIRAQGYIMGAEMWRVAREMVLVDN
jgi:hypothetical protein